MIFAFHFNEFAGMIFFFFCFPNEGQNQEILIDRSKNTRPEKIVTQIETLTEKVE